MPPTPAAIARLYQAKGRPAFNPLIAHVPDLGRRPADRAVRRPWRCALAEAFWPGPLTLVLPKAPCCPVGGTGDRRARHRRDARPRPPGRARHPARPSAARWWRPRPTSPAMSRRPRPQHVLGDLAGRIDLIVDGGPVEVGRRIHHRRLLRPADAAAAGRADRAPTSSACSAIALRSPAAGRRDDDGQPLAPGMLASHYAPRTPVRLNASDVEPGEALLAFGPGADRGVRSRPRVTESVGPAAISSRRPPICSAHLRALDARGAPAIARDADSRRRAGRSHQRPAAPRRRWPRNEERRPAKTAEQRPASEHAGGTRQRPSAAAAELIAQFRAIVGDEICRHRRRRHRALPHRGAQPLSGPLAPGAAAGLDARKSPRSCKLANRAQHALVPQGGNTGLGRRADAAQRRGRAVAQADGQDPRDRRRPPTP